MKAITFPEANIKIAENQDEFLTLPAYIDDRRIVVSKWELNDTDLAKVTKNRAVWLAVWNGEGDIRPVQVSSVKPLEGAEYQNHKFDLLKELKEKLSTGVVRFIYVKKSGEIREAYGTLSKDLLSTLLGDYVESDTQQTSNEWLTYYDLNSKGFRKFEKDRLIGVS